MTIYGGLLDTLLVGGTDLRSLTGIVVGDFPYWSPGTRRQSFDTVPGRQGQSAGKTPLDAYQFSIPITVMAEDPSQVLATTDYGRRNQMVANLRAVTALLGAGDGPVTLARRIQTGSGTYVTHEARGYVNGGTALETLNYHTGKTELDFTNLDGCWYDSTATTVNVTGGTATITVPGDFATRNMTIDLPGAGYLVIGSEGFGVSGATTLDVGNFTSTAGFTTVIGHAGDKYWFVLRPGSRTIDWTGSGTPVINYKAAWS